MFSTFLNIKYIFLDSFILSANAFNLDWTKTLSFINGSKSCCHLFQGEARFDNSIGETGQRRLIFSPHRASFQPYQITLPTVYKDGKAGVHIFTSEKEENTVPDSPDKTESETLDDLKKVEVAQLKIKVNIPNKI